MNKTTSDARPKLSAARTVTTTLAVLSLLVGGVISAAAAEPAAIGQAAIGQAAVSSPPAAAADTSTQVRFNRVGDTFAAQKSSTRNFGSDSSIRLSRAVGGAEVGYVSYAVDSLPQDADVTSAKFWVYVQKAGPEIEVWNSQSSTLDESALTYRNQPWWVGDARVGTSGAVTTGQWQSIDVSSLVRGNGAVNLVLTAPKGTSAETVIGSRETGAFGGRLVVEYRPAVVTPPAPDIRTLYGASPAGVENESAEHAFTRIDGAFGGIDAVRWWPADGSIPRWSSLPSRFGTRALSLSFKVAPNDLAAGRYDADLVEFFRTAPRDRQILVTYFHEPEDNIAAGQFTAAQYRAAWDHFGAVARAHESPNVKTALILMGGTFRSSDRDWHDYASRGSFQVMGGDDYQFLKPHLATAAEVIQPQLDAAEEYGLPIAILELGAKTEAGDQQRATFLSDAIALVDGKAIMVLYFESWRGARGPWNIVDVAPTATQVWRQACLRN